MVEEFYVVFFFLFLSCFGDLRIRMYLGVRDIEIWMERVRVKDLIVVENVFIFFVRFYWGFV